ncbi:MAG: PfkB family carbohydrate kinase [Pseudomonadota bacterium]
MTGRLVQLSSVIVDHIYRIETVPQPGEEAVVHDDMMAAGGAFNAMVAARRCGLDVAYAGTLGTGPFSDLVAEALMDEQIEVLRLRIRDRDQGCCTVLIDRDGERSFITSTHIDGSVTVQDLQRLPIAESDWSLLSGYTLSYAESADAMTAWLKTDPAIRLVFDPSPVVGRISRESLAVANRVALWVTANRREALLMTGADSPENAARILAAERPDDGGAIVRAGEEGCLLADPDGGVTHIPALEVQPIDTNGAGDAHVGAFIAMLAKGQTPDRAARVANACAALSTTRLGPSAAPDLETTLLAMGEARQPPIRQQAVQN